MKELQLQPAAKKWIQEKGITSLTVRQVSVFPGGCCSSGAVELLAEPGLPSRSEHYQKVICQDTAVFFPRPIYEKLSSPSLTLQNYGLFKSLRIIDTGW